VSFALDLRDEPLKALTRLPLVLQERILDELDRIAALPFIREVDLDEAVFDFIETVGTERFYVFVVYRRDLNSRTVRVRTIHHIANPLG
jgi:hypothetical protein